MNNNKGGGTRNTEYIHDSGEREREWETNEHSWNSTHSTLNFSPLYFFSSKISGWRDEAG